MVTRPGVERYVYRILASLPTFVPPEHDGELGLLSAGCGKIIRLLADGFELAPDGPMIAFTSIECICAPPKTTPSILQLREAGAAHWIEFDEPSSAVEFFRFLLRVRERVLGLDLEGFVVSPEGEPDP